MQTNHAKAISGLSIAVVVISAITLVACIVGWFFVTWGGSIFNQYGYSEIVESLQSNDLQIHGEARDLSADDIMMFGNFGLAVGGAALIWEAVMSLISLIAGILGLKNAAKPEKLGKVFGWSIAGAICAFLGGRLATMVLLIIVAVFSYKDKNSATSQPLDQPYAQAYSQPMAQPMASTQPSYQAQPAMPPQPYAQPTQQQPAPEAQPQVQQPSDQQPPQQQ